MNRKIKFRAWDTTAHEWNKTNDINFDGNLHKQREMYEWELLRDYSMDVIDDPRHFVLMQYTGMKDKHGKEIYEGDVLLVSNAIFYQVVFYNGSWSCFVENGLKGKVASGVPLGGINLRVAEVIGNIFQNPDLIQKGGPQ